MEPLEKFFARYQDVMARLTDVAELDSFMGLPWMAITPDGTVHCFHTIEGVRKFTQTRFDVFWKEKLVNWTRRSYDVTTVGPAASLVSINWEVCHADGTGMRSWRHYYMVAASPQG